MSDIVSPAASTASAYVSDDATFRLLKSDFVKPKSRFHPTPDKIQLPIYKLKGVEKVIHPDDLSRLYYFFSKKSMFVNVVELTQEQIDNPDTWEIGGRIDIKLENQQQQSKSKMPDIASPAAAAPHAGAGVGVGVGAVAPQAITLTFRILKNRDLIKPQSWFPRTPDKIQLSIYMLRGISTVIHPDDLLILDKFFRGKSQLANVVKLSPEQIADPDIWEKFSIEAEVD